MAIVYKIREGSKAGRLYQKDEIYLELMGEDIQEGDDERRKAFEEALKRAIEEHSDIKEVPGAGGALFYYSEEYMGEPYVRLLLQKQGDPLLLIAETVRDNSASYPRPIPLNMFKNPPFDFSEEEIIECLRQMETKDLFRDIARTVTSAGTVFLYSTSHLTPDYASMLAEWFDVGQFENP
ncbi:MAG: hypothetical protein N2745_09975 [Syntrophorhabdaceae bacterium]|nr:hypothetical protein [Syntrophorhabdaceae bacterium]